MGALFHNKTVQSLAGWHAVLTAIYYGLGALTPQWFGGLTWPQAILVSWGAALLTSLILALMLAAGAYGFRCIRPLPSTATAPLLTEKGSQSSSQTAELADLSRRIESWEKQSAALSVALNRERFRPLLSQQIEHLNTSVKKAVDNLRQNPASWSPPIASLKADVSTLASLTGLTTPNEQSEEFNKNPFLHVDGDDLIADMGGKQEYRAAMDQANLLLSRMHTVMNDTVLRPLEARELYRQSLEHSQGSEH